MYYFVAKISHASQKSCMKPW